MVCFGYSSYEIIALQKQLTEAAEERRASGRNIQMCKMKLTCLVKDTFKCQRSF